MLRTRQAGTKQLDLRVPVDELRDNAEAAFGNAIAAPHGFGKEEQFLLNRGRQVREHQHLAHARPAGVPELGVPPKYSESVCNYEACSNTACVCGLLAANW